MLNWYLFGEQKYIIYIIYIVLDCHIDIVRTIYQAIYSSCRLAYDFNKGIGIGIGMIHFLIFMILFFNLNLLCRYLLLFIYININLAKLSIMF